MMNTVNRNRMRCSVKQFALILLPSLAVVSGCHSMVQEPRAAAGRYVITSGPLEIQVGDLGVDAVLWRDRCVFGDSFEHRSPVIEPQLITDQWQTLARVEESRSQMLEQTAERVRFTTCGSMAEVAGPGRWRFEQEWTVEAAGRLTLLYRLHEDVAPGKPLRHNRVMFLVDRKEVLAAATEHRADTPGNPVTMVERGGKEVATTFGAGEASTSQPAAVRLPFAGRMISLRLSENATWLQTWNAGWRQAVNVEFPAPKPAVECQVDISISELAGVGGPLTVQRLETRPAPWLAEPIPALPKPAAPLRFVQCTPSINQWHDADKLNPDETRKMATALARHFDVAELFVAYADWQYAKGWDTDPAARQVADRIAAKAQEWIDIGHQCGLNLALSLDFGGGEPGTGTSETRRLPQFQAERFAPDTGEFVKTKDQFDWANAKAREFAYQAWFAVAAKIKGVDFLFFNEPLYRLRPWYQAPFFSEAALGDFRAYCRDPRARFPAKPYACPTPRTDNSATLADWRRWEDWVADVYVRQIAIQCRAVADANRDNPRYQGAIWFQNVNWVGSDFGTDLDRICAISGVRYVVCEYCTSAASPHWRKFRYFAAKHGRFVGSFVNIGHYDAKSPGAVKYDGTVVAFEAACRMGVDENAAMVALYPADSFYPWSPAYNQERVNTWDKVMTEYLHKASE
ncbi:MAG: hypothetical protein A3K19_24370 [Lentisphaerae bacterium RIFOXYB12_FULL_65_16]|nr:MAG: hypothetical protein A3K18_05455 [Lentisphaerae bacterium RIFOXYA12_64_32]OGV90586.1 MAG: hypothetical protein A3K19_24370 [Lentisphaerae bacterium RIFOXYB12_FULL_65_16]